MPVSDPPDRADAAAALAQVFDRAWYARRNPDVIAAGVDPLHHFLQWGWDEGRWPNRYFDPRWYRQANPDVVAAGLDPLLHYLRNGEAEGRPPHALFDPAWYRTAYRVPDGQGVLAHFLAHCATRRMAPGPSLWAVPFLPPYSDDLTAGRDPIEHFLDDCEALGREPFPDPGVVAASGLVEDNYYLINGSDVHAAGLDPADHYCRYGWREQRRPNIYFDPVWYARTNPEVMRLQVNPLLHYIVVGEAAGRRPVPFFDPGWYRQAHRVPPEQLALSHYLAHRRTQTVSPTPLFDVADYVRRFAADLRPGRDPFAHYLQAAMRRDIDPGPDFDAAQYRRRHMGRPSRAFAHALRPDEANPLVHFLRATYAAADPQG